MVAKGDLTSGARPEELEAFLACYRSAFGERLCFTLGNHDKPASGPVVPCPPVAEFSVPGAVIVAIWGLETTYGDDSGNFRTFSALATLAYDCRRSDRFRAELIDALRIVQRGDMSPAQMRGAWAGEIGPAQFMPSSYLKYAVDFNGDGRRDLVHDTADILASTANFLYGNGWRRGAGWDEGEPNFSALLEWNQARVYAKTIALFADRLSAPSRGQ